MQVRPGPCDQISTSRAGAAIYKRYVDASGGAPYLLVKSKFRFRLSSQLGRGAACLRVFGDSDVDDVPGVFRGHAESPTELMAAKDASCLHAVLSNHEQLAALLSPLLRYNPSDRSVSDAASRGPSPGRDTCWIVSDLNGRIFHAGGNLRKFLNLADRSVIGRDIYTFINKDREYIHRMMLALAPDVTIERDLVIRPRDHKPVLVHAMITRHPDDLSFLWHFSLLS